MAQGRFFDEADIERIVWLLSSTDMSISEIAQRMSCSRSAIASINRKRQVRNYGGRRTTWRFSQSAVHETASEMAHVSEIDNFSLMKSRAS